MNLKLTNLGIFNKYLEEEIQDRINKKKNEADALRIMVLDAEARLLKKVLSEYGNLIVRQ